MQFTVFIYILTEFVFASSEQIWAHICALHEITGHGEEKLPLIARMMIAEVLFAQKPSHNQCGQNGAAI